MLRQSDILGLHVGQHSQRSTRVNWGTRVEWGQATPPPPLDAARRAGAGARPAAPWQPLRELGRQALGRTIEENVIVSLVSAGGSFDGGLRCFVFRKNLAALPARVCVTAHAMRPRRPTVYIKLKLKLARSEILERFAKPKNGCDSIVCIATCKTGTRLFGIHQISGFSGSTK